MSGPAFDVKERVRQANDIVDLVGSYLTLRRQGSHYVANCPWHDDRRPSLQINPVRQTWKCWVCDLGGDVFSFVMKRDNVEFGEALRILASRAGIPLTESIAKVQPGSPNDKQTLYDALKWVAHQYHQHLLSAAESASARAYLANRNITPASIQKFRIGFAPDERDWIGDLARPTSYSPQILKAIGVLADSSVGTSNLYERFRGRVMFPIFDLQDRVVGFGGAHSSGNRPTTNRPGPAQPAKYVNSPETRVFSKSDQLYGLSLVREAADRPKELVVVEGYTDVVAAWQAGLENAVAVLGTALNDRHLRLMKRFVDRVVLLLDGDEAGRRRANETLELFIAADLDLRVLTLPDGQDPCEYLEHHSTNELRQLISTACDAVDHKIAVELSGVDIGNETHRATTALESILQTIARRPSSALTGSGLLREQQILTRLARQFACEMSMLKTRVDELRGRIRPGMRSRDSAADKSIRASDLEPKERELLEILIVESSLVGHAVEHISPSQMGHEASRSLYEAYCQRFFGGESTEFDSVMTHVEDSALKSLLAELDELGQTKRIQTESNAAQRLNDVIGAFERASLEAGNRQAIAKLQQPLNDQEETSMLLEVLERARRRQDLA